MKKIFFTAVMVCACMLYLPAQAAPLTARSIANEAAKKETADESVTYIQSNLAKLTDSAEKRSMYAFLGSLQEQLGNFNDARDSYAAAAAIAAGDAPDMTKKSSGQLVLDAVRCSLSTGDSVTADSYLNSAVRNSKDSTIQAYIKLYSLWSSLCKIEKTEDLAEPVVMLKAYAALPSMGVVKQSVLLTLWYITGDNSYADTLKKEFPSSPETGIVTGIVQMLPAPFWYFLPRQAEAQPEIAGENISDESDSASVVPAGTGTTGNAPDSPKSKKLQMGLFREKANADSLVSVLVSKGFKPYITTETRASGTTYYIVVIDETDKSMEDNLRTAGFEFCPVF